MLHIDKPSGTWLVSCEKTSRHQSLRGIRDSYYYMRFRVQCVDINWLGWVASNLYELGFVFSLFDSIMHCGNSRNNNLHELARAKSTDEPEKASLIVFSGFKKLYGSSCYVC